MAQYTGFEGYTDDELVKLALARGDYLITEIAQRFEEQGEIAEEDAERLNSLDDNRITDDATTWALLGVLADHDIETTEALEAIIAAGEAYMSLEQALNENTAVMRELIATLKGAGPAADVAAEKPQPKPPGKPTTVKAEKPKADAPVPAVVDRAAITKKLVKVGKDAGRDAALGILKKYGAKNLGEVPDDKLAEIEADFDRALDELEQVAA